MPYKEFSEGTAIDTSRLAGLRVLANLMPLHRQKKILNDQAGGHTSRLRGRGIDFSEVREYQPGDDIRSMDWRVTARTGDAHIKVFREERERPVLIACDLRASMNFGTRRALKQVVAADIAALLAWSAMNHGDRVGGLVVNDDSEFDLRPHTGRKNLMAFLHQLASVPRSGHKDSQARMLEVCRHIARVSRPGSAIYIISDWAGFDEECERTLHEVSRHCDLIAIHISDPFERQMPEGEFAITDGNERRKLRHNKAESEKYKLEWQQKLDSLQARLLHLRMPLICVSNDSDPLDQLRRGFGFSTAGTGAANKQGGPQ